MHRSFSSLVPAITVAGLCLPAFAQKDQSPTSLAQSEWYASPAWRTLLEQAPGEAIRLALLAAHYRQPLDWTSEVLPEARRKLDRLYGALRDVEGWQGLAAAPDPAFIAALDDDLNTPQALAVLFNLARDANRSSDPAERAALAARLQASAALLGLLGADPEAWFKTEVSDGLSAEQVEAMLAARRAARANRDFRLADQIRDQLVAAGILIEDSAEGTRWRRTTG